MEDNSRKSKHLPWPLLIVMGIGGTIIASLLTSMVALAVRGNVFVYGVLSIVAIAFAIVSGIAYALLGYMVVFAIILIATISCVVQIKNRSKKKEESDESLEDLLVYADDAVEKKTAELEAIRRTRTDVEGIDLTYDVAMWAVEVGEISVSDVQRHFSMKHDPAKWYIDRLLELGVLGNNGNRKGKMVALMTEEGVNRLYNQGKM